MFASRTARGVIAHWRRALLCAAAIALLSLLFVFWGDFCLWRAEASLVRRNDAAAVGWIGRSFWFGRSEDARTSLLRIRLARRRQEFEVVDRELHEAVRLGAPPAEIRRERLLATAQTGQFDALKGRWPELLRDPRDDGPEIARAYYAWSMLNHDFDQARRTLELWQADYPNDSEPLAMLGRYFQAMHDWEGAEDAYRSALELSPADDDCRLSLARVLTTRLDATAAIPFYRDYLQRHPDDVEAIRGLAQCAATQGDLEEALNLLRVALRRNPDDFAAQKAYGELLLTSGDAPAAVEALERAFRTVPEHANLANSLARALKICGRTDDAKALFDFVEQARSQLEELPELERALRARPHDLELRMRIAEITAKYVSRRDAMRWYENLLRIAPRHIPAQQALAELKRQTDAGASSAPSGDAAAPGAPSPRSSGTSTPHTVEAHPTEASGSE